MKIVAVSGSVRPGNFTSKALALVADELTKQKDVELELFDPRKMKLALPGLETDDPVVKSLQRAAREATGIVLATPEYHGSYSSVIKMVIENLGYPSGIAGKPIALLGVAAGRIGAIKALEHLRSVCSHVGGLVLPGVVSVAGVSQLFDAEGRCLDEETERRIRGLANHLVDYIQSSVCPKVCLEEMARAGT